MNATVTNAGDTSAAIRALTDLVCGFARARDMGGDIQARSFVERAAVGYSGVAGGFLLKPEMASAIRDHARLKDGPFARCNFVPTKYRTLKIPIFNETSRANKARLGGVQANVGQSENLSITGSQPSIGQLELNMNRLDVYIPGISRDILADTQLITPILSYAAFAELRFQIDAALITGSNPNANTGGVPATCPRGIMNTPSAVKVTRQTSSTITQQDVDSMWAGIASANSVNLCWHCTKNTINIIDAISQSATSFWPENIYIPAGKYGNTYPSLKGRPVIFNENCSQIGTPGDLVCADWGDYMLAYHSVDENDSGIAFAVAPSVTDGQSGWGSWGMPANAIESRMSDQFAFLTDAVAFLFKLRCDGDFVWVGPETDVNGQTVGPCAFLF